MVGDLRAALQRSCEENIALRCLLGAGCDANNDGSHSIVSTTSGSFCADCGEMVNRAGKSKPWMNEDRLQRSIERLRKAAEEDPPRHGD